MAYQAIFSMVTQFAVERWCRAYISGGFYSLLKRIIDTGESAGIINRLHES